MLRALEQYMKVTFLHFNFMALRHTIESPQVLETKMIIYDINSCSLDIKLQQISMESFVST